MNTLMWEHPATVRHLRQIADDVGSAPPVGASLNDLIDWINAHSPRLRIVEPESRRLACGDVGVGAMANVEQIAATIHDLLAHS
jgi:phosphopantothenoylcysteine decarboxylase